MSDAATTAPTAEVPVVNLRRKVFAGTLWSLLENVGAQASSFVLFLIFARLIDPR